MLPAVRTVPPVRLLRPNSSPVPPNSTSVTFFFSPSEATEQAAPAGRRIRLGGLVEAGSVVQQGATVTFAVTDNAATSRVVYEGDLPDLFREGQGIVAQGVLRPDGVFAADEVLAKHDETYMPKEVADAVKRAGFWQHDESKP